MRDRQEEPRDQGPAEVIAGVHTCLGNHLARLEITIMLEELTRRLPHLELVEGQELTFSPNTTQRGPESVPVGM